MASMFENYENLSSEYIPSNLNKSPCTPCNNILQNNQPKQPYEQYDAQGKLVGYWWNYGDTINLEFELTGDVQIESTDSNPSYYLTPKEYLKERQIKIQLYNFRHEVIDTKLFDGNLYQATTFTSNYKVNKNSIGIYFVFENNTYIPKNLPQEYESGKTYYVEDPVRISYVIDPKLSEKMQKGAYYCSLSILDKDLCDTIVSNEDMILTVK